MEVILYSTGIVNLLFVSLLLGTIKKGNKPSNRWLAGFFLIAAILLLQTVFEYSGFYQTHPSLIEVFTPVVFFWGPTYFLYTQSLTKGSQPVTAKQAMHALPALAGWFLYLPLYTASDLEKLAYLQRLMSPQPTAYDYLTLLCLLHFVVYLLLSIRLVNQHQEHIRNYFSNSIAQKKLSWLKWLNLGMLFIWLLWANFHLHQAFPQVIPDFPQLRAFTPVMFIGLLFALAFYAFRQNMVFPPQMPAPSLVAPKGQLSTKPPFVPDTRKQELKQNLLQKMEEDKEYRNSELTLPELATKLNTSTNILSELINHDIGLNFYEFVNRYRVEECKAMLANPAFNHYTILGIAFESGFNSKSTFHKVFSEHVGQTPTQYQKESRKGSPSV